MRQTTFELENKNIALKEIISQIELERKALQDQLRMNIELTVLPLLSKLQNQEIPQEALDVYLKIIRQNLEDVTSSLTRKVIEDRLSLSPREFELCNLIKNGLPNKKIAELMRISLLTVERHRHNIRKKLHIDNEGRSTLLHLPAGALYFRRTSFILVNPAWRIEHRTLSYDMVTMFPAGRRGRRRDRQDAGAGIGLEAAGQRAGGEASRGPRASPREVPSPSTSADPIFGIASPPRRTDTCTS